jgi:hypothetical protein
MLMDYLINWETFETTFKGEKVTMELLPLDVGDYSVLAPYLKPFDNPAEAVAVTSEIMSKTRHIIGRYVRNIKGITINGEPPTAEILTTTVRLSGLFMAIIQQLVLISLMSEEERKNSRLPSDTSLTDGPMGPG